MTQSAPALELRRVDKDYATPQGPRRVLDGIGLEVARGERVAIIGKSGSGKSTLLHLASLIDAPSAGKISVSGIATESVGERERTLLRRDHIGLVFQFFHLLPHLSVIDNVLLGASIAGERSRWSDRAKAYLERVGLANRATDPVTVLSGGEMQRVALCRALLRKPSLVVADEPTGNLDEATEGRVLELMLELVDESGAALLVVTHSREVAQACGRVLRLQDGQLSVED